MLTSKTARSTARNPAIFTAFIFISCLEKNLIPTTMSLGNQAILQVASSEFQYWRTLVFVAAEQLSCSIEASASLLYFVNSHHSTIIRQINLLIQWFKP